MCGHFNIFDGNDNQVALVNYMGDNLHDEAVFEDSQETLSEKQLEYVGTLLVKRCSLALSKMFHNEIGWSILQLTDAELVKFNSLKGA